jgi:hypothetical protein
MRYGHPIENKWVDLVVIALGDTILERWILPQPELIIQGVSIVSIWIGVVGRTPPNPEASSDADPTHAMRLHEWGTRPTFKTSRRKATRHVQLQRCHEEASIFDL